MDQDVSKMRSELTKRLAFSIESKRKLSLSIPNDSTQNEFLEESVTHLSLEGIPIDLDLHGAEHPAGPPQKKRVRRRSDLHAYRHRIMQILVEALLNPVYVEWNIKAYAAVPPASRVHKFPHPPLGSFAKPATLVDVEGAIIMWYLPHLLPNKLHTNALAATRVIDRLLSGSVKAPGSSKSQKSRNLLPSKVSWRISKSHLAPPSACRKLPAGSINFSGGWFAQGHTTVEDVLKPSYNLRTEIESKAWLGTITEVEQYINTLLSLTHPELYDNARVALDRLRTLDSTKDIAALWSSVFTGIAVISNRITPSHTDRGGRPAWYDTLLNIGTCPTATFQLPDLSATFSYPPGTIISLCGNILKHQVNDWGIGDRVCYAHFMRHAVLQRLKVDDAGWVHQADFEGLLEFLDTL